ncbi:MAG: LysR family transcriptional regulator [Polyangiales bacterium]
MESLNYHHLHYFWLVTEEGSLSGAARRLRLTHSTLSTQLRSLEEALGGALFERRGKRLVLTPFGDDVRGYATDIFRLGNELLDVAGGRSTTRGRALRVGTVGTLPKTLTCDLLEPALALEGHSRVMVRQDSLARLVESLAAGRLDLVLADEVPADRSGRIHAHVLGETEILLYATPALARKYRGAFPASLQGAPFVMPSLGTTLRRNIDQWLLQSGVAVRVEAEVDDAALLRVFGARGRGVFPVRASVRAEIESVYRVVRVGACVGLRERYYALSVERRVRHPAVAAIIEAARANLPAPRATPRRRRA